MRQRGIEKGQRDGKRHRREGGENRRKRREREREVLERERETERHTHTQRDSELWRRGQEQQAGPKGRKNRTHPETILSHMPTSDLFLLEGNVIKE